MGKKKVAILGSENEEELRAKRAVQREQKKKREGKLPEDKSQDTGTVTEITTEEKVPEPETPKEIKKEKAAKVRSKHYQEMKKLVPADVSHTISEGIDLVRKVTLTKFDASLELHITFKEKNFNKEVELPHPLKAKAKKIVAASDDVIAEIEAGKINFDVLVATPAQMGKLVKFAKILGPRGLMPNPKNGTVTENIEAAIKKLTSDKTLKIKTDKDGPSAHLTVGKLSMTDEQLTQNISAVLNVLPAGKVHKIILKSTMSPAVKLGML